MVEITSLVGKKVRDLKHGGTGVVTEEQQFKDIDSEYWANKNYDPSDIFVTIHYDNGGARWVIKSLVEVIDDSDYERIKREENQKKVISAKNVVNLSKKRLKFFSHETNENNLSSILKTGLNPKKAKTGFRGIKGKYVMFTSIPELSFSELYRSGGGSGSGNSVYVIFKPTGKEKHVLDELPEKELVDMPFDPEKFEDWWLSRVKILPSRIVLVWNNYGDVIYKKN